MKTIIYSSVVSHEIYKNKELHERLKNLIKNADVEYLNTSINVKNLEKGLEEIKENFKYNTTVFYRKLLRSIFLLKAGMSKKEIFKDFLILLDTGFYKGTDEKIHEEILKELENFKIKDFNKISIREFNFLYKTILNINNLYDQIDKYFKIYKKPQGKRLLNVLKKLKYGRLTNIKLYENVRNIVKYIGNINENELKNTDFRISSHNPSSENISDSCSFFNENFTEIDYNFIKDLVFVTFDFSNYFVNKKGFFAIPNEKMKDKTSFSSLYNFLEVIISYYIIKAIFEISKIEKMENFKEIKIVDFWKGETTRIFEEDIPDEIKKIIKKEIIKVFSNTEKILREDVTNSKMFISENKTRNISILNKLISKLSEGV